MKEAIPDAVYGVETEVNNATCFPPSLVAVHRTVLVELPASRDPDSVIEAIASYWRSIGAEVEVVTSGENRLATAYDFEGHTLDAEVTPKRRLLVFFHTPCFPADQAHSS